MSCLDEKPTCCGKTMTEESPWFYSCRECNGEAFPYREGGVAPTSWEFDCPWSIAAVGREEHERLKAARRKKAAEIRKQDNLSLIRR
ncbi:MAG: hypothetical protein ACPICC_02455 [Candidatus Puniceispirillaceae bacterium]